MNPQLSLSLSLSGVLSDQLSSYWQAVDGRGGLYVADESFSTTGSTGSLARAMISLHNWQRGD